MVKSTAISDAGITKQTLYEVGRDAIHPRDLRPRDRILNHVNGEIEALIKKAWGRE